uniref:Protein kinase domain-containing protein n=1 Tax=viral metagenome TaxID=1070528 RepID=A0A6C0C5L6_9ZZZZ
MISFHLSKCFILGLLIKYNIYNDKLVKILLNNVYKCGVIPIKMIQWGLPLMKLLDYDKNIINILENTYEKCPIHDIEYTKQIFNKDFYDNISNEYEIIDLLGSGSIAQVYKIKDIKSDKLYAMKVKHPNVNNNFNYIKLLLQIIFKFIRFENIIPISLNEFLDNFEKQLNLLNEGNNIIKFNELYHNNNLYKIPNLYKISENIIIMDYLEGVSIETFKHNNYKYSKFNLLIYIFMQNNVYINKFNHGDLHNYNWKVTNENKIVIYDYGLCWKLYDNYILDNLNDLIDGLHVYNYDIIYKGFHNFIKYNSNINDNIIKNYFYDNTHNIKRLMDFFKHILIFCIKYKVKIDITLLYIIISWQNIALIFMKNYNDSDGFEHNNLYTEEYSICDYYKIFPEYQIFLKGQINKFKRVNNYDFSKLNKFIQ